MSSENLPVLGSMLTHDTQDANRSGLATSEPTSWFGKSAKAVINGLSSDGGSVRVSKIKTFKGETSGRVKWHTGHGFSYDTITPLHQILSRTLCTIRIKQPRRIGRFQSKRRTQIGPLFDQDVSNPRGAVSIMPHRNPEPECLRLDGLGTPE